MTFYALLLRQEIIDNKYLFSKGLILYRNSCIIIEILIIRSDYPGIGNLPKGKLPPGAGAPGNAAPLPLASNSAAASGQEPASANAQGGPDYCPGGSEAECINFCPPEDKVLTVVKQQAAEVFNFFWFAAPLISNEFIWQNSLKFYWV